jgi:DNA invertase Pin-like site-specific DNA recombinase
MGVERSTVKRAIVDLEQSGRLRKEQRWRENGGKSSNMYYILKAAEEGKMDVLLIKKLDRLGRDTVKTLEFIRSMEQLGIELYSPLEGEIKLERSPYLSMQ